MRPNTAMALFRGRVGQAGPKLVSPTWTCWFPLLMDKGPPLSPYKITLSVLCRRVMIDNYAVGSGCGAHSAKLAIHQALLGALLCAADGELSLLEDVRRRLGILAVISTGSGGSPAIGIGRSHSCFKTSMSDNFKDSIVIPASVRPVLARQIGV